MDRGAWWATVHGVAKNQTQLIGLSTQHNPPLQYSWASLVVQLVKHLPAMWETGFNPWVGKISWGRERLPSPVFWPGEFHGLYIPRGHKGSDTTDQLSLALSRLILTAILIFETKKKVLILLT